MTDMKPCPFCGGKATLLYVGDSTWQVICDKCGSCSDYYNEEWEPDNQPEGKEAIKAWNTRQVESELNEEIKRLREALEGIKEVSNYMSAGETTIYDSIGIYNTCCDALEGKEE